MIELIQNINLFDFVNAFLCDSNKYSRICDKAKKENMFMLFRILAAKYPTRLHQLNGCESIVLMDALQKELCTNGTRTPQWVYNIFKGKKSQDLLDKTKPNVKLEFCKMFNTEDKNLIHFIEIYGVDKIQSYFKAIEKKLNEKITKKRGAKPRILK